MGVIMNATKKKNTVSQNGSSGWRPDKEYGFHPLQVLVKRRWQLFACLMIVGVVAFVSVFLSKPSYRAVAQVQVTQNDSQRGRLTELMSPGHGGNKSDYFRTQCELLQSQHVLDQAAQNLQVLQSGWAPANEVVDWMRDRVKVQPVPDSKLIDIVGVGDSGPQAAAIANQVMDTFIQISNSARQEQNQHIQEEITGQIGDYDKQIQVGREQLSNFLQDHQLFDVEKDLATAQARIGHLEQELTQVQMQYSTLKPKTQLLQKMLANGQDLSSAGELIPKIQTDKDLNALQQNLQQLHQEESRLAQAYLPGHRKLREVQNQIANLQVRQIELKRTVVKTVCDESAQEIEMLTQKQASLQEMLKQQRQKAFQLTKWNQEYQGILANVKMMQSFKNETVQRLQQFTLEQGMVGAPVVVVDKARIPARAVGLSTNQRAASILLLGLLFSVAFILALEKFSLAPTETSPQTAPFAMPAGMSQPPWWPMMYWPPADARQYTGGPSPAEMSEKKQSPNTIAVLGSIRPIDLGGPSNMDLAFAARCRVVHADQRSVQAETFREISTQLLQRFGRTGQSVVVTSQTPQSGKTTCACNLALVMAQAGRRVALVDLNPKAPALSRVFSSASQAPDVGAVLADPALLDQAIQDTDVAQLQVINCHTSGATIGERDNWYTQIDRGSLAELDRRLAVRFDWVIYDTGSLDEKLTGTLLQTVGKALAVRSDNEPGISRDEVVKEIERNGAISIGFVENAPLSAAVMSRQSN